LSCFVIRSGNGATNSARFTKETVAQGYRDEGVISIAGRQHRLWRAADQEGYVLDEIVKTRSE